MPVPASHSARGYPLKGAGGAKARTRERPPCPPGRALPPPGRRGPARRYCSASCRAAASKKRRADAFWSKPQGEAILAALPAIALEPLQMGDVDEVALTVLWAWGVVGRMAHHAREDHPKIACRCELVGTRPWPPSSKRTSPRSSTWVGVPTPRPQGRLTNLMDDRPKQSRDRCPRVRPEPSIEAPPDRVG